MLKTALAIAAALLVVTTADARPRHHQQRTVYESSDETLLPHPAGCPRRAFCGCGVSVRVFGSSVRSLWPARAWLRFPRSAAGPGAVAVWHHHVAYIEALDANGNAVLYDPNSGGHRTRRHVRSLAGATIVNPTGAGDHRHHPPRLATSLRADSAYWSHGS